MSRRPIDRTQLSAVLLSTLLAASIVGAVALAPAVAEHPDDAPDYTGQAYFEISEVSQSDHHPGDHEGSLQYFSGGAEAFKEQGAEEGVFIDYIIVDSYYDGEQWIDYTNCNTENTASFGIDRGNNNSGTNYDDDLVQHQKQVDFRQDGITIEFYDHSDLGGDPPYMAPEDAIVAQQGEGSAAGPCLQFTDEPGWYRMEGFLNGTVADNGRDSQPSENADQVQTAVQSTWFYICDCDSREEAEQELGPPPEDDSDAAADDGGASDDGGDSGGDSSGDSETTATPGSDDSSSDDSSSDDSSSDDSSSDDSTSDDSTSDDSTSDDSTSDDSTSDDSTSDDSTSDDSTSDDQTGQNDTTDANTTGNGTGNDTGNDTFGGGDDTPNPDEQPGFGALAALIALLGGALLANRRL